MQQMSHSGDAVMVCSFAKFVIHYRDGTTITEDRDDNYAWDNAPKEDISALGILYDPGIIHVDDKPLRVDGLILRYPFKEHTLRGSKKYHYGFFQFKDVLMATGNVGNFNQGRNELGLVIGMVINSEGNCIVMHGKPSRNISTYFTTVHSLRLDYERQGIYLEDCGKPIGQDRD